MTELSEVRIDKWLWAARCFKTRSMAGKACAGGHVKVDGHSAKASKTVRVGAHVEVQTPGGLRILEIAALGERRGPASEAQKLYVDNTPPPPPRELVDPMVYRDRGTGRPSKRDLRDLRKIRGY